MDIGGVKVPGSRAFKFGVGTVAGIVLLGIVLQIALGFVPFLGGVLALLVGIGAPLVGGAAGAYYAANLAGVTERGDGAKAGVVIGAIGNTVAAVVGILVQVLLVVVDVGGGVVGGGSIAGGILGGAGALVVLLILGTIGIVTGAVLATIGGAVGGAMAAGIGTGDGSEVDPATSATNQVER